MNVTKEEIISKILQKPYTLDMGAGKLSRWWNTTPELIREAKAVAKKTLRRPRKKLPRILLFDIETSPVKAFVWQQQVWRANIPDDRILSQWFMLSWSAKWLDSQEMMSDVLSSEEALAENDKRIIVSLWKLLDEADIVITHNGDIFDVPNMNTRFLVHNLLPTSPYQTIDTFKVVKKQFGFTHNSLNGVAKMFGFDPKMSTSFALWSKCVAGDKESLLYLEEYNRYDVELLEAVYLKLRPWMFRHPNLGLYTEEEEPVCPKCMSKELEFTGYYYTSVSKFETYKCSRCGSLARRRSNAFPKKKRPNLLTTLAR